jgi:hypothetical protein
MNTAPFDWLSFAREVAERTEGVERSPGAEAARLNALVAVELDPIRRRERLLDVRLAAAVAVARRVEVAEALLAGAQLPTRRLDPRWVAALGLEQDRVTLTDELALEIVAHGPFEEDVLAEREAALERIERVLKEEARGR